MFSPLIRRRALSRRELLASAVGMSACAGLDHVDRVLPVAMRPPSARAALEVESGAVGVYQIGHSTHLLSLGGRLVLTDPWFRDPADVVFHHQLPLGFSPEEIGPVNLIVISHDHGDHFDLPALDRMDKSALVLVATSGMKAALHRIGFREVEVPQPWERVEARGLVCTATTALHYGYEINYVLSEPSGKSVFFGGDTAWHDGILRIGEQFAPSLAFLPVDGTHFGPRGRQVVMNPTDAVRAAHALRARTVIPTHAQDLIPSSLGRWLFPRPAASVARFLVAMRQSVSNCDARVLLPGERLVL
jgi:L-ascorbate metabolism protein UlaG (beta-lactamase superfamily)